MSAVDSGSSAREHGAAISTVAPIFMEVMQQLGECDVGDISEAVRARVGGRIQADTNRRRVYDCGQALIGAGILERVKCTGRWSRLRIAAREGDELIAGRVAALREVVRAKALSKRADGALPMRLLVVGGRSIAARSAGGGVVVAIAEPRLVQATPEVAASIPYTPAELEVAFNELLESCPAPEEMEALRWRVCQVGDNGFGARW